MNTEPPQPLPPPHHPQLIVRPREWMREVGVGKHGLAILIEKHGHPKPIPLGARSKGFLRVELDAWIATRQAQRDATANG
jgi:predicted DNA-binding transcriptional regulator AlpA